MFSGLARLGRPASHNRPYAGGYVLERHGAPRLGIHALQLEVARASYLDSLLAEPGDGFEDMVTILVRLVRAVAAEVAELGRAGRDDQWPEAAE
jgi:N-formylglutamate amidohydrolase